MPLTYKVKGTFIVGLRKTWSPGDRFGTVYDSTRGVNDSDMMMGVVRSKEFLLGMRRQHIVICNLHHECRQSSWKLHGYPSK